MLGDFNAIRKMDERRGRLKIEVGGTEMNEFNNFIQNMEPEDAPLVRRRFTWYKPNSHCKNRLDRYLVSKEWLEKWLGSITFFSKRSVPDHFPLVLKKFQC